MGKRMKHEHTALLTFINCRPLAPTRLPSVSLAAEPAAKELGRAIFRGGPAVPEDLLPGLATAKEKQEGKLNLAEYDSLAAWAKNQQIWELVLERR